MRYGAAIVIDRLGSEGTVLVSSVIHDREFGVRLLYQDPGSGAEHYLIRYPAGLGGRPHRHTAAHTVVVLEGHLVVNEEIIGPGGYCHFPAGEPMFHAPAGDEECLFVTIFHGPYDVESLEE